MSDTPVYVILGASGSVGSALCAQLTARSAHLVLGGRDEPALAQVSAASHDAPFLQIDARQSADIDACVELAMKTYGRVDGLVNCVGSLALKPLHLVTDEALEEVLAVNLKSAVYATRAAVKVMDKKRGGSIVLMSSAAARYGMPNHELIAAAKAGILGLMLSAAATYAPANIRINAVAPGLIDSKMTQSIVGNEMMAKASAALHALGRYGSAEHVASMTAFLLDPANDFITGQTFGVDGGLAAVRPKR